MKECHCNTREIEPKCKEVNGLTIVVIPEQLGGSSEGELYAPKIGEYKNAIVKYLADGLVYVYDKDGNWTLIADIKEDITVIDSELSDTSTNAVENRVITEAINDLTTQIEAEQTRAETAENSILNAVYTEATTRESADTTLQNNINAEAATREQADTALQTSITSETTARENADTDLRADITAEATARQTADTTLQTNIDNEATARQAADTALQSNIDAEAQTRAAEDVAIRASLAEEIAQETADIREVHEELNRNFVNDLEMLTDAQSVTFIEDKINPYTGQITQERDVIPTASATTAGTMSAAEFNSITDSQEKVEALLGGAVAITGLSASITQAELTAAWMQETGRSELINRASIYDITNSLVWTYYTNVSAWEPISASGGGGVTVSQFTNNSLGTIKGSTLTGNVSANADGTGSVSGWSALNNAVSANTTKLATIANGAEVNVQSNWTETNTSSDAYIQNKPTLATVATSGAYTDLTGTPTVDTALSTSSTNAVQNRAIKTALDAKANTADLATVATSGSYNDLTNKPTIDNAISATSTNAVQNSTIKTALDAKANTADLATVATSGSFADLTNVEVTTNDIANGAITNAKLATGSVKSDNVDWTTIGTILFSGSWNSGSVTLSDSIQNYSYIDIYAISNDNVWSFSRFFPEASTTITVIVQSAYRSGPTDYYIKHAIFQFSGAAGSLTQQGEQKTNSTSGASSANNITIKRIVGYK